MRSMRHPDAQRSLTLKRILCRQAKQSVFRSTVDIYVPELADIPSLRARSSATRTHMCRIASLMKKLAPFSMQEG